MDDLKNILNDDNSQPLDQEKLLRYLNNELNPEEQHEVERAMANSPLVNDAVEGLQELRNTTALNDYVNRLNKDLHKQIKSRKGGKKHKNIQHLGWIITAVVTLLLLCLVGYVVLQVMQSN